MKTTIDVLALAVRWLVAGAVLAVVVAGALS